MPVNTLIQVRRGNKIDWDNAPATAGRGILYQGELGYELDTGKIKIGDGTTHWGSGLCYASVPLNTGNFIAGSGININLDSSCSSGAWSIDESWLDNFIANSSGAVNTEAVQDIIGANVVGGFGINSSYNDGSGDTTISATGLALRVDESTGIGVSVTTENSNNVYTVSVTGIAHTLVTDWTEAVQDTIGLNAGSTGFLVNGTGVAWTYDDSGNSLEVAVTGIPHTLITDWDAAISGSIPDNVDTLLVEGDGIGLVYNSGANSLTIGVTGVLNDLHDNLTATAAELNVLDGVTAGTVSAGDAVVVDGSKNIGDFNAVTAVVFSGDLVGDVTGNADTATEATNVTVTANNSTNETVYLTFVDGATGTQGIETDTALSYNPSTDTLTVGTIVGDISGGAAQVQTVTTDTGTHYLTFVDSDNGSATAETVRTDGDLSYNAATNTLSLGNISTTGTVNVGGDLVVAGTTTTVNSTVVEIGDNVIRVNTSGLPTGGFEVLESGTSNYKQFVWDTVDGRWELGSENLQANTFISTVASGTAPLTITSPTLVNNLNADLLDGEHGSYYLDWGNFSNTPTPDVTVAVTGDVAGSSTVSNWNLSDNLSVSINTTIQPNSVALGTDTTGQYATTIGVAGVGLSGTTPSANDGTAYTITSNATSANTANTIVSRDASGNFSAGTITATLNGNASTASTATNANNINISATTSTDTTTSVVLVANQATGNQSPFIDSGLTYNANTDALSATSFVGALTGNASSASQVNLANETTDAENFMVFANAATGNQSLKTNTSIRFDASSGSGPRLLGSTAAAPTTPATRIEYFLIDGGTP